MKKLYFLTAVLTLVWGCEHNLIEDVNFYVSFDSENTYYAGEKVVFNFDGNAENIVFYSGEKGSEYQYHDRYAIPAENIESAQLSLDVVSQYGKAGALEIWVTDKFSGLWGDNQIKDREIVKSLASTDMTDTWTKLDYTDPGSGGTVKVNHDIAGLKDNFCIAFHWNPLYDGKSSQRTYRVNGEINLGVKDMGQSKMTLQNLDFTAVMMNPERDAYVTDKKNGSIILDDSVYSLFFKGCGASEFNYALDGWAISRPRPLNKIENDKGMVIKNTQNYMDSFEYVWNEAGTYEVVFVVTNSNYTGSSEVVKKMTINIVDKFKN